MQITKEHPILSAFISALVALPLIFSMYFIFEPTVAVGQGVTDSFTITQTIDEEIAFTATTSPVTMTGTLSGLTGGSATGDTGFAVATNAVNGYTVEIAFDSVQAMVYEDDPSFFISNLEGLQYELAVPAAGSAARFAYTVTGDNVVDDFRESGSTCNEDAGTTSSTNCWYLGSSGVSSFTIIDSDSPTTGSGDEADIYFRVVVPQNPTPALPTGNYTATATLTATTKP